MDDVSLEVIQEPPVILTTPLDEYYVGEIIPWIVSAATKPKEISIGLLSGNQLVNEQRLSATNRSLSGVFESGKLTPGVYTLEVKMSSPAQQIPQTVRRQILLTPDPFDWQ
jgi:hypothetical protein